MWRSPPPMMLALSRSRTDLAEALTCRFLSSYVARRCLHNALSHLAKRDLNVKRRECGSFS